MDRCKKARGPLRAQFTRVSTELESELGMEHPDPAVVATKLERMEVHMGRVRELDEQILNRLLDEDLQGEYEEELSSIEVYEEKMTNARIRVKAIRDTAIPLAAASEVSFGRKKSVKLPKIELKRFNDDFKEWLGFWAQFSKIDEDEDLHDSDKFQYLVQAMENGSRAKELVESYPQSTANYPKAVEALKNMFGKDEVLLKVYVRELLKLVIHNATNSKERLPLNRLYVKLESHLRALESLGVTNDRYAIMLFPLVESCVPEEVLVAWQRSILFGRDGTHEIPPRTELSYLMEFLKNEVENEASRHLARTGFDTSIETNKKSRKFEFREPLRLEKERGATSGCPTAAELFSGQIGQCIFCDKNHDSQMCIKAQDMSLSDKNAKIKMKKACFLCLKSGHRSRVCRTALKCNACRKRHTTIMCPELQVKENVPSEGRSKTDDSAIKASSTTLSCSSNVILKTLWVTIVGNNRKRRVRALVDDGSQRSYVLKKIVNELGLESVGEEAIIHTLFSGLKTTVTNHQRISLNLEHGDKKRVYQATMLDQDIICNNIPQIQKGPWIGELKKHKIWISDVGKNGSEIGLLIGADIIGDLLTGRMVKLKNGLMATETILGWTLMGKQQTEEGNSLSMSIVNMALSDSALADLWKLETIGIQDSAEKKTKEEREEATREHFLQTVSRSENGRYLVSLPWIDGIRSIPSNRAISEKRLKSVSQKLHKTGMYNAYEDVFRAWLDEGIIEEVPENELNKPSHYIPHHAVLRPDSLTTPVRPVFDASCKSTRTPSLNECLEKGPNLLELIPTILMRFREGQIGITSDIRKAFLMIEVKEADRDFLRFLWWENRKQEEYRVFRHRRVVFGVNCSPYLLGAVIEYHLNNVDECDKIIARKLLKSFYVDNCVTSVDTLDEYKEFRSASVRIMANAKMDLRLWQSNVEMKAQEGCTITTVLGLKWNTSSDTLFCSFSKSEEPTKFTKREVLSYVQKVFDPIGFLCPMLICPKILLQQSWELKLGWDEELPEKMKQTFRTWCRELEKLSEIRIPRNVTGGVKSKDKWQIHTFCDASKDAYATVIYLRTYSNAGVSVQLIQAKSRVSPLRQISIPRLELLSCCIGARLTCTVKEALNLSDVPTYFWTDSSTCLAWIKRNDEWGTFVGNRVKEIIRITRAEDWRHIPGEANPADLPSRGCSLFHLLQSRWWEGPQWLRNDSSEWPAREIATDERAVALEKKKCLVHSMATVVSETPWYIRRFSEYSKNVRVIGWVKRFLLNASGRVRESGHLSVEEYKRAEETLLRLVQKEAFCDNATVISGMRVVRVDDLIRVKTRLLYRDDLSDFKLPILVPTSHPVTELIIREEHISNGHAGAQYLMGNLRERYWIIQGRRAVRKVISRCVRCRRFTSRSPAAEPSPLPEERINFAKVFEVTGVDLAGPLHLKDKSKTWIVLFTCAVFRAIHLEMVTSLSTEAFLEAFQRFVSRRGRPSTVYSDNGTNFVGAVNLFRALNWDKITRECGIKMIQWKFNPPSAAWWGGWWERLIRTVKDILRRILGNKRLTFEQMSTILCECEAIVNKRPLTYVTEDPEDLIPLTPAMFLQQIPETRFPEREDKKNLRKELELRFRREYFSLLVQRGKERSTPKIRIGDLVLIGCDNKKRWEWPIGKVLELLPGKDGNVRVVKVKTAHKDLLRPIQRLYPLEVSSPTEPLKMVHAKKVPGADEEPPKVRTRCGRLIKAPDRLNAE